MQDATWLGQTAGNDCVVENNATNLNEKFTKTFIWILQYFTLLSKNIFTSTHILNFVLGIKIWN